VIGVEDIAGGLVKRESRDRVENAAMKWKLWFKCVEPDLLSEFFGKTTKKSILY
jgi:hypothetical protein